MGYRLFAQLIELISEIVTGKTPINEGVFIVVACLVVSLIILLAFVIIKQRNSKNALLILDKRAPNDKILNGAELSVCYTLKTDDITKGKTPSSTPYIDREDVFNSSLYAKKTKSRLKVKSYKNGKLLELNSKSDNLSEFGINLPFNFMGKKNGGGWENQFLFNTPYYSKEQEIMYFYLTKPNGNNLLVAVLEGGQGWKMDYSPYSFGHYFLNLKILANYDKAYNQTAKKQHLKIAILPVTTFENALEELSDIYGKPFLDYTVSGGEIGKEIELRSYGSPDTLIEVYDGKEIAYPYSQTYKLKNEGETTIIPSKNGKRGTPVSVYAYDGLISLYKKSVLSVNLEIIKNYTDGNLCEHQSWLSATLRYLIKYKSTLTKDEIAELEGRALAELDVITEQSIEKAVAHQTIWHLPHDDYGAYNVYKSNRVQELFFGITILLDAHRYFGDEKYLKYLKGATQCLISNYQGENGRIEIDWGDNKDDYTTVCAPMIPLVDTAIYLEKIDPELSSQCKKAAEKMAEYLYKRGISFPTEGIISSEAEDEMEDGSISCTALCLLYYCKNLSLETKYLEKAKEILDLHSSWIIKAPICQMKNSTLRWWETQWEGDGDGPAICAGHAWTIWRAEADYLYYKLTGDEAHLIKSHNGFMTNLSKIDKNGKSYAIYNPDLINGGGFHWDAEKISFKIAHRFPTIEDCGLSRYVWIRINDTFLS